MAVLGKWSGGVKTQGNLPESWTAPASLFDTQDRNDGSAYGWAASTSTLTLPSSGLADGYLLVAAYEYQDTSNGRFNPQGRFIQASGTGTFVSAYTGGYDRDNSEDRAYVRTWAFVDGPSASATFQFQWKADTDDALGGTERSELQVIPFYYADIGLYSSTDHATLGGTTPNQVPGFSGTDGTNITISSNVVSLTGDNKRYLILGSTFNEGRGGRTQRWGGFRIDGTKVDHAKSYFYPRNTSNDEIGSMHTHLLETATATITVDTFLYRGDGVSSGQGGADVDGSDPGVGLHTMVILELNDSAEVFANSGNANQNIATTGPIDVTVCATGDIDINDSASWTRSTDTAMNAEVAMDALLGANLSAASQNVSSGQRFTGYAEVTVNGTEDADSFHGNYLRNAQTSQDCFGWSANLLGFQALSLNDDVGVSCTELSGSEGGGGAVHIQAGWAGFWGINLDTLAAAADLTVTQGSVETLALTEQQATITFGLGISATVAALTLTEPQAAAGLGVNITAGSAALNVSGPPTNGLVGYWPFDEGSGTNATDRSGQGVDAPLDTAAGWGTARAKSSALSVTGAANSHASIADANAAAYKFSTADDFSVAFWAYIPSLPSAWQMMLHCGTDAGDRWACTITDTNKLRIDYSGGSFDTTETLVTGWSHFAFVQETAHATKKVRSYINGVEKASIGSAVGGDGTGDFFIGARRDDGFESLVGRVDEVAVFSRALTAAELTTLAGLYSATVDLQFPGTVSKDSLTITEYQATVALVSAGLDVDANTDALVIAEQPAALALDRTVSTAVDALAIAEQQATISFDLTVSGAADALAITEPTAAVELDLSVSAGVDALAVTEPAATIDFGRNVTAATAALSITEQPATIVYDSMVTAATDAVVIAEQAATITYDSTVTAATDALVITENAATLELGVDLNVNAAVDALTITDPRAAIDWTLYAAADALALTEQPAATAFDLNVAASTDALAIAEQAAQVSYAGGIAATADALILTEQPAAIDYSVTVAAGTDAVAITEPAAAISYSVTVAAGADALAIAEPAAGIGYDTTIAAGMDALALTEALAGVGYDVQVAGTTDALAITENTAVIAAGFVIPADIDAVLLTEQAAGVSLDLTVNGAVDALVLDGQQASVPASRTVAAELDALAINGLQAAIAAGLTVTADTDALWLNGLDFTRYQVYTDVAPAAYRENLQLASWPATITGEAWRDATFLAVHGTGITVLSWRDKLHLEVCED